MSIECYKSECPKHNRTEPFCDEHECIETTQTKPKKTSRPETLDSRTHVIRTGHGKCYITVSLYEGKPFEVFCFIGKSGASTMAKAEVTGRLISLALRHGVPLKEVVHQLIGISGDTSAVWEDDVVKSIPDAVGKILTKHYLKGDDNAL